MEAAAPHREWRAALSSALCHSNRALNQYDGVEANLREHLDNTLKHWVWIWGEAARGQELALVLMGPFQLRIFCSSVIISLTGGGITEDLH